jgi:hypothetical protein
VKSGCNLSNEMNIPQSQVEICRKYRTECLPLDLELKLGVSEDFFSGTFPLNGLRHSPEGDTCGWYLWSGKEMSVADDYFQPVHVFHLIERCAEVIPYLGLPAGWRFLLAGDYEDVWFDPALLATPD